MILSSFGEVAIFDKKTFSAVKASGHHPLVLDVREGMLYAIDGASLESVELEHPLFGNDPARAVQALTAGSAKRSGASFGPACTKVRA